MFKRKIIPIVLLIIAISSFVIYNVYLREDTNNVEALSKYGSRGDEVRQIQTKLKRWGYYSGSVDGITTDDTSEKSFIKNAREKAQASTQVNQ